MKGIFWLVDGKLLSVKCACDKNGTALEKADFSSKSGDNFNHAAEWSKLSHQVTHGKPFNFYPRGRVEIKNGKVTVYLNPSLNTDMVRALIISEFELADMPDITFKSDGSKHYGFVSFFG